MNSLRGVKGDSVRGQYKTGIELCSSQLSRNLVMASTTSAQLASFSRVQEILAPLNLSVDDYREIAHDMGVAMTRGYSNITRPYSSVKMFPSYVTNIPTGNGKPAYMLMHFNV